MTKRHTPSPEPPEDRHDPGRPPASPPGAPGLSNTTEALPEGVRVLAWDGGSRYLVTDDTTTRGRLTGWVVDTATGAASPPVALDSALSQTDPDEWTALSDEDRARYGNPDYDGGDWIKGRRPRR